MTIARENNPSWGKLFKRILSTRNFRKISRRPKDHAQGL